MKPSIQEARDALQVIKAYHEESMQHYHDGRDSKWQEPKVKKEITDFIIFARVLAREAEEIYSSRQELMEEPELARLDTPAYMAAPPPTQEK